MAAFLFESIARKMKFLINLLISLKVTIGILAVESKVLSDIIERRGEAYNESKEDLY